MTEREAWEALAGVIDPELGIDWPLPLSSISEKDESYPLFTR